MGVAYGFAETPSVPLAKAGNMMSNADGKAGSGEMVDSVARTGEPLNRIVAPLTVLFAQVQLLRRRIERAQEIGSDHLREAVERMDTATRAVIAEIREMETAPLRMEPGTNPDGMEGPDGDQGSGGKGQMTLESTRDDGARATPEQMLRKHVFVVNGSPEFLDIVRQLL